MLCRISAVFAALVSAQIASFGASPAEAAQHCGDWAHWVQTGPALGAGYCKKTPYKYDHYVSALGYHYVGNARCVRNGSWWTGRRPVEWGPYYERRHKSGSVSFQGPNGGELKLKW